MEKEYWKEIKRINPWWQNCNWQETIYVRDEYVQNILAHSTKLIDILIGARRVGKTFILKDIIQRLSKKYNPKNILYITAELPILQTLKLNDIIQEFLQTISENNKPIYILIDEVQELKDWQTTLKYYVDTHKIKFIITGSSSLILNQQTSKLTGRFLLTQVFPLNYRQFLNFRSKIGIIRLEPNEETAVQYLETGGYPEYVLEGNQLLLTQTVESILYRDLLSLHGIRNPALLKTLLALLCDKVTTPLSAVAIAHDLKVDRLTVQSYLQYLQDVYLIFPLYRRGRSHRIVKGSTPKYYLNDTGVLRLFSRTSRIGHLAENAVFLSLKQQYPGEDIFYDIREDQEIDLLIEDKKYEVKYKPIINPQSDIIYVVPKVDVSVDARQIPLWKLLDF